MPVRMVNAHVFCPRLFWLEHVEGLFEDNEHTLQGQHVHRRVDQPGGCVEGPEGEGAWHARSLWLSSVELGLTGKVDLVEAQGDGSVMPVDTKKGVSCQGSLWAPDRVQLSLQALLLRAAGYRVASVGAWYHEERRRVVEPLTEAMIEEALGARDASRVTSAGDRAPPPLVGSSKCFGCSLNAICLPDETHHLQEVIAAEAEAGGALRRVFAPREETLPLHVVEQGATLRLKGEELQVVSRGGETLHSVGMGTLSHVSLYGQVHVTGPALRGLMDRGLALYFFSSSGWYRGRTQSTSNRQVQVRMAQFRAAEGDVGLGAARVLIADKISNVRTLLRRNRGESEAVSESVLRELQRLKGAALRAERREQLLGVEGQAASVSWPAFSRLTGRDDEAFAMRGRTRRPPRDRVNALLSFLYGMLTRDCAHAVESVGLDPFLGVYHTAHHGRPSMALDLMEPFRPLVADSVALGMIRRQEVSAADFTEAGQQVLLKPHARRAVVRAYERRMDEMVTHPVFGYPITYRRVLYVQARLLARFLQGELSELASFRTR